MTLIAPVADRISILPYFLKHYAGIGITRFVLLYWQGQTRADLQALCAGYPVDLVPGLDCALDAYSCVEELQLLNQLREDRIRPDEWFMIVDLDELCWFHGRNAPETARLAERLGYQALHGHLVDRIARDGRLACIRGQLDHQFPLATSITQAIGACADKYTLSLGHLPILLGHHIVDAEERRRGFGLMEVHHFKWVRGLEDLLNLRAKLHREQGFCWHTEHGTFLSLFQGGALDMSRPEFRVRLAHRLGV